jgi:hypothetical protein
MSAALWGDLCKVGPAAERTGASKNVDSRLRGNDRGRLRGNDDVLCGNSVVVKTNHKSHSNSASRRAGFILRDLAHGQFPALAERPRRVTPARCAPGGDEAVVLQKPTAGSGCATYVLKFDFETRPATAQPTDPMTALQHLPARGVGQSWYAKLVRSGQLLRADAFLEEWERESEQILRTRQRTCPPHR